LRDRNSSGAFWSRVFDGSTVPLALALAGCWLSDAPLGVMGSYALAAIAITAALTARSWAPIARTSIATTLGLALTGLYLLPAAWEQRWIDVRQAASGDPNLIIENNWLFERNRFTSTLCVVMVATALLSLFALWRRGRLSLESEAASQREGSSGAGRSLARHWWVPLALIPVAVFFLQFPVSLPVYNLLPKLRFLQFPSRWLLVLEAPMAIFFAAAIWPGASARRWRRGVVCAVCALLFAVSMYFASKTFLGCSQQELPGMLASYRSGAGFWGAYEYAPPGADNDLVATRLPDGCLVSDYNTRLGIVAMRDANPEWRADQGSCIETATAQSRQPERLRIAMDAGRAGYMVLRLRRYPAWRVTVNGRQAVNLPMRADGLIAVPVPQGPVDLKVDWTTAGDVIAGRWLSGLAVLLLTAVGFLERRLSRPRASWSSATRNSS